MHFRELYPWPDFPLIVNVWIICFGQKVVIEPKHRQFFNFFRWHDLLFHPFKNWVQKLTFPLHNQAVKLRADNLENSLLIFEEVNGYIFIIVA